MRQRRSSRYEGPRVSVVVSFFAERRSIHETVATPGPIPGQDDPIVPHESPLTGTMLSAMLRQWPARRNCWPREKRKRSASIKDLLLRVSELMPADGSRVQRYSHG